MMGSYERDYFSPSIAAMDDHMCPRPIVEDSGDEVLFTVSGCNTPILETAPVVDGVHKSARRHRREPRARIDMSKNDARISDSASDNIGIERSRPIPIEHSKPKPAALIEPVSARGDLAVAYFPMHEKEGDSVPLYQPHPFDKEAKRARQLSIDEAEASAAAMARAHSISSCSTGAAAHTTQRLRTGPSVRIAGEDAPERAPDPGRRANQAWRARTAPVVDAYNPTGIPGSAASLGKYYPSNYSGPTYTPDSSSSALQQHLGPASALSKTEQARRLRQYQRDMISQTLQNAREALSRTMQGGGTTSIKAAETALDEGARRSVASGFALLRRYKPLSPRITPLLSPGPVTPMALDGEGESDYLTVREARSR